MNLLNLYRLVLACHVVAGLIGLAAFWVPAIVRKGGTLHKRAGRIFYLATCGVAATGFVIAVLLLAAPLTVHPPRSAVSPAVAAVIAAKIRWTVPFLAYLLLITFVPVYHGVRVLATKRAPETLRTPLHTALAVASIAASIVMVGLGLTQRQPVFLALSPIGFLIGAGNLQFARKPYPTPMAWWYEHMGSMIGGGIAFHTAFLVLGAGRLFGLQLTGAPAAILWILPTIIGIPATEIWVRYYRRKFNEVPAATGAITGQLKGDQGAM
jgi:hypothetical protein